MLQHKFLDKQIGSAPTSPKNTILQFSTPNTDHENERPKNYTEVIVYTEIMHQYRKASKTENK